MQKSAPRVRRLMIKALRMHSRVCSAPARGRVMLTNFFLLVRCVMLLFFFSFAELAALSMSALLFNEDN